MIVATGLDLTEQKELRDDLEVRVKQRTQELEEKNQALLEQAETVRELSGRLLRAQDEERRRIARDLHDSSGQILAAVQMNLTPLEVEARNLNSNFAKGLQQSIGSSSSSPKSSEPFPICCIPRCWRRPAFQSPCAGMLKASRSAATSTFNWKFRPNSDACPGIWR